MCLLEGAKIYKYHFMCYCIRMSVSPEKQLIYKVDAALPDTAFFDGLRIPADRIARIPDVIVPAYACSSDRIEQLDVAVATTRSYDCDPDTHTDNSLEEQTNLFFTGRIKLRDSGAFVGPQVPMYAVEYSKTIPDCLVYKRVRPGSGDLSSDYFLRPRDDKPRNLWGQLTFYRFAGGLSLLTEDTKQAVERQVIAPGSVAFSELRLLLSSFTRLQQRALEA